MKNETLFKLKEPIEFGSEIITEIKLASMKAKHLRGMNIQNMQFDDFLTLIGNLGQLTPSQVDELGTEDLFEIVEVVGGFLGGSQEMQPTA